MPPAICCTEALMLMNAPRSCGSGTADISADEVIMRQVMPAKHDHADDNHHPHRGDAHGSVDGYHHATDQCANSEDFKLSYFITQASDQRPGGDRKKPDNKIDHWKLRHRQAQVVGAESAAEGHQHKSARSEQRSADVALHIIGYRKCFNEMLKCIAIGFDFQVVGYWPNVTSVLILLKDIQLVRRKQFIDILLCWFFKEV